jgi:hypothetical protein
MPTKVLTKNATKTRYSIPISFNLSEKYALQELALESSLPVSTFIKLQLKKLLDSKTKDFSKTKLLLSQIKAKNLKDKDIDLATKEGAKMRKNLKLTSN